ncbi:cation transporter [Bdellovibrionota bacterium FG-2]
MPLTSTGTSWIRWTLYLAWFTIGYNLLEGVVSIGFGLNDESVALAGFGADSLIEVASAILVLWRFRGEAGQKEGLSINRERQTTLGIGVLFIFLALLTALASALQLKSGSHPSSTLSGLVISAVSLSFMFFLWQAKKKAARILNSATVRKDAACSLACIKLSIILFFGSLVYLEFPAFWWIDSVAGLGLALLIAKEGWETVRTARRPDFSGGCGCACD